MQQLTIDICLLGKAEFDIDIKVLRKYRSKVFLITDIRNRGILPECDLSDWGYSDEILAGLFQPLLNSKFTVGVIDAPLEDNYYMRRISKNQCVISLFEIKEILQLHQVSLEHFIVRNIYELILIYHKFKGIIPTSVYQIAHSDIRRCLFDMSGIKTDILYSMIKPIICEKCTTELQSSGVDKYIIKQVTIEIRRINIDLTKRLISFIKKHPFLSISLTSLFAVFLNVVSNLTYNNFFNWS